MEQFTAISGKNIPKLAYKAGENFSIIISTDCTDAAIVAINVIKTKKLKSTARRTHQAGHVYHFILCNN